jgi:hypothetical protein
MAICKKCGGPIGWKRLANGKWCPTEPNGGEHWDECRRRLRAGRPPDPKPALITRGHSTHFWIGMEPPWDESLGGYRDFTDIEKIAREVCAP